MSEHLAESVPLGIIWKMDELPTEPSGLGYGVCILGLEPDGNLRMVAFVEGFTWLLVGAAAVVRFDRDRFPTGTVGDSLRFAIYELVRTGRRRMDGKIAPGFRLQVNR